MSCFESYRGLASPRHECKNGDTYRGFLDETEDNMNCILKDATRTDAKGNKTAVEHIRARRASAED